MCASFSSPFLQYTNVSSTLTVDLAATHSITKLHINWGSNPAVNYSVAAGPSVSNLTSIASGSVNISAPYDASTAEQVAVRLGNTTEITLPQTTKARFLNLTVVGSMLADGKGPTVAEFAVI